VRNKFKGTRPFDVLKVQEVGRDKGRERMPQGFIYMLRSPSGQYAPAMLARCPISSELSLSTKHSHSHDLYFISGSIEEVSFAPWKIN